MLSAIVALNVDDVFLSLSSEAAKALLSNASRYELRIDDVADFLQS